MIEAKNDPAVARALERRVGGEPIADDDFMRRMAFEKSELNAERARFEVAFRSHKRERKPNGAYKFPYVQHAFEGWIERAFAEWECRDMK